MSAGTPRSTPERLVVGVSFYGIIFFMAAEALRDETAVRLAAEALREETAVRRDVIEALHRRVEELERELAMRAVQEV